MYNSRLLTNKADNSLLITKVYMSARTRSRMQILYESENKQMIKLLPLCQGAEMKLRSAENIRRH